MSYVLQKLHPDGQSNLIPDGLKQLMTDISREVLRDQPESIYEYIAEYLEEMVLQREQRGIAENLMDKMINDSVAMCELLHESGMNLEGAQKSAKIMEESFKEYVQRKNISMSDSMSDHDLENSTLLEKDVCRKILETCNLSPEEESELRKIVQICYKNFYFREKSFTLKANRLPDAHWFNRTAKTLDVYRKGVPNKWQLERAAVVIQSTYRGYYVRKVAKEIKKINECATKIQSCYRAHVAKKTVPSIIQANFRGFKERKMLLNRIKSLQHIQEWSKYIGLIRSLVKKIVSEAMGVMEFEPDMETYAFLLEIINKIIMCSIPDDMKEIVEVSSEKFIDEVVHSAIVSSFEGKLDASSSFVDKAAIDIQRIYRGYKVRRDLERQINSILQMLNVDNAKDQTDFNTRSIEMGIFDIINSIQDAIQ